MSGETLCLKTTTIKIAGIDLEVFEAGEGAPLFSARRRHAAPARDQRHELARPTGSCAAPRCPWRGPPCGPASATGPSPAHRRGRRRARRNGCSAPTAGPTGPPSSARGWCSAICSTITGATPSDGSSSSDQQRIAHQRARDGEHLLLAAAHVRAGPVRHAAEIGKQREQLLRRPGRRGRPSGKRRGGWRPMSRFSSTVRSEKMRRSSGTKPRPSRAISNGCSREMSWPQKRTVPVRRAISAHERLHRGRLAGAVAAHQRDHLAAADVEATGRTGSAPRRTRRSARSTSSIGSLMARARARRRSCRCRNRPRCTSRIVADRSRRRRRRSACRAPAR